MEIVLKSQWMTGFDGFYLTSGHHSKNASATLHDVYLDQIAWFTHRTKRGKDSNWQGTSSGAEGDIVHVYIYIYIYICIFVHVAVIIYCVD